VAGANPTTRPSGDLIPTIGGSGDHPGGVETREEPGTLTQGGVLFSLVPLVWESNPKLQGGWSRPTTRPSGDVIPTIRDLELVVEPTRSQKACFGPLPLRGD
jgi:hypothetical protein